MPGEEPEVKKPEGTDNGDAPSQQRYIVGTPLYQFWNIYNRLEAAEGRLLLIFWSQNSDGDDDEILLSDLFGAVDVIKTLYRVAAELAHTTDYNQLIQYIESLSRPEPERIEFADPLSAFSIESYERINPGLLGLKPTAHLRVDLVVHKTLFALVAIYGMLHPTVTQGEVPPTLPPMIERTVDANELFDQVGQCIRDASHSTFSDGERALVALACIDLARQLNSISTARLPVVRIAPNDEETREHLRHPLHKPSRYPHCLPADQNGRNERHYSSKLTSGSGGKQILRQGVYEHRRPEHPDKSAPLFEGGPYRSLES